MPDKYRGMPRREFLAAIGRAVGGLAMILSAYSAIDQIVTRDPGV